MRETDRQTETKTDKDRENKERKEVAPKGKHETNFLHELICDSQHEHEENMGHRSMLVCTRISLYIYI